MFICQYCARECKNDNSLRNHERLCKENPNRQTPPAKTQKWRDTMKGRSAWNKGLTKETSKAIRRQADAASKTQKKKIAEGKGCGFQSPEYQAYMETEEYKREQSARMLQAVRENPDSYTKNNVCGRVKIVEYNGVKLKGQWELKVARWLDSQNISWENEPRGFDYYWNNSTRKYYPDFYIPEHDVYIEVKGYKTERDDAKWTHFPGHLVVVDKKYIDKLEDYSLQYIIEYGTFV